MAEKKINESEAVLDSIVGTPYKYGFTTNIGVEEFEKGLNSQIVKNASLKTSEVKRMIDFASLQRQIRILGKLSQVFLELKRSERLKDFKTILKYLMTTSLEYDETKRYSDLFKNLIPFLEQRLKTL